MRRWVIGLCAMLVLAGCSAGSGSGGPRIAVVTPYLADAATKDVITKFQRAAEAKGWEVTVTDTAGDFNRLNSEIQNAAARKPSAIVLGMGDPAQMGLGLRAARDAAVPRHRRGSGGRHPAPWRARTDCGGEEDPGGSRDRRGGQQARHGARPGGGRQEVRAGLSDRASGSGRGQGGVGGVGRACFGATQAIQDAGRDGVAVVSVDGQDFALAEIRKGGPFKATVRQDWDAIADRTVALIADDLTGKRPAEREYKLSGQVITG